MATTDMKQQDTELPCRDLQWLISVGFTRGNKVDWLYRLGPFIYDSINNRLVWPGRGNLDSVKTRSDFRTLCQLLDVLLEDSAHRGISHSLKSGVELIAAERERQVSQECWTAEHDDCHDKGELARAAACYAVSQRIEMLNGWLDAGPSCPYAVPRLLPLWPFDAEWWKPSNDPLRNLVKAGALIAAEIDRIQRYQLTTQQREEAR